jgi:hypothetical protein
MKTVLPHKVTGPDTVGLGYWASEVNAMSIDELQKSHNQLIDVVAELREVVEGVKQKCMCGKEVCLGGAEVEIGGVCHRPNKPCYTIDPTPSLKEQLLGEIEEWDFADSWGMPVIYTKDVEAIIQRLMP